MRRCPGRRSADRVHRTEPRAPSPLVSAALWALSCPLSPTLCAGGGCSRRNSQPDHPGCMDQPTPLSCGFSASTPTEHGTLSNQSHSASQHLSTLLPWAPPSAYSLLLRKWSPKDCLLTQTTFPYTSLVCPVFTGTGLLLSPQKCILIV